MTKSQARYKLLYVAGAGASGSTLLTRLLGNHPDVVSIGEVYRLERYAFTGLPCSCGVPVQHCEFWTKVLEQLKWPKPSDRAPEQLLRINSRFTEDAMERLGTRLPALLFWKAWKRLVFPKIVADNLPTTRVVELLSAIHAVTGKTCFVDSSKNVPRWWALECHPDIECHLIHVVRDGRAYLYSRKRRVKFSRLPAPLRGLARIIIIPWFIKRWIQMNLSVEWGVDRDSQNYIRISYDDLARKPLETLALVLRHCDLSDADLAQFLDRNCVTHQIAGSNTAFKVAGIQPDTRWKQSLSIYDRVVFLLLAGWLNKYYKFPVWRID